VASKLTGMSALADIARRGWPQAAGTRERTGGRPSWPDHDILSLSLRLFFWAAFCLPAGLALRSLWRVPTQTRLPRRLRRLTRQLQRRRQLLVPVPPLRRPVPNSSPGAPSGIAWPADNESESIACDLVWGEDVYAPFLAGRPAMRLPTGQPTAEPANDSLTGGGPNTSGTGDGSSIRDRSSLPPNGSRYYFGWDGLPHSWSMPSDASDESPAAGPGRPTPADVRDCSRRPSVGGQDALTHSSLWPTFDVR
jgi:hypothetical protein